MDTLLPVAEECATHLHSRTRIDAMHIQPVEHQVVAELADDDFSVSAFVRLTSDPWLTAEVTSRHPR